MGFGIVTGPVIKVILADRESAMIELVMDTYRAHAAGDTVNPDSYFLRFPNRPEARIIALPAHLERPPSVSGIKWISSFPSNHDRNLPRASAVLVLNDPETGVPFACLEGAFISATRTAASVPGSTSSNAATKASARSDCRSATRTVPKLQPLATR